ncbi:hypothetical protein A1O3_07682 [Capronia epimyces CBS 606.96]|uniref:FAD-binding FR-type domain-containing protein n=1 Tax=Capronia epimyces CBS 606.96 TaxID=1182542 RepID=W9XWP3_9EURO|nr:uncharacterized protein A1O3_07682 [Capronia epimyces CBS 606.96]EXJ81391.1 hypothetical protein A1O3_07682 [Capronia epimyces CBS 606.96]
MRFPLVIAFLASSFVHLAVGANTYCATACKNPLSYLKFNGTDYSDDDVDPSCSNLLEVQSYYVCLRQYCTASETKKAVSKLKKSCDPVSVPPISVISNLTVESLRQVEFKDLRKKTVLGEAVLLSETLFGLSMRTLTSADESDARNIRYGHAAYGYWGVVLLVGMITRISTFIRRQLRPRLSSSPRPKGSLWRRARLGVQQYITTPALFRQHSAEPVGWCTIPPRLQALTIFGFVVVNVVLSCVDYDIFAGNVRRPNEKEQLTRWIGRRTGVLATANLPLMFTFAMRNNVLSWLTGWNYATFSQFHRWIARMAMTLLFVHAVTYTLYEFLAGGSAKYYDQWLEGYWAWGIVAFIVGCFMTAWASYPVRRYLYEAFLVVHIVLAIVFLVGTWYHLKKQDDEYVMYFWPCVAVWAFDRLMRIGRVLLSNLSTGKALVKYNPQSGLVRLEVPARLAVRPQAGTYYYIYVLHGFKFWESHPFTLSSWEMNEATTTGPLSSGTLSFIIQPQDSFTARLRQFLIHKRTSEDGSTIYASPIRVLIEGPYGHSYDLQSHDSALIIVGGSGVTVAVSHLRSLRESMDKNEQMAIRKVHVVWVVRHQAQFQDLLDLEVASWLDASGFHSKIDMQVDIYVTHKGESMISSGPDVSEKVDGVDNASSLPPSATGDEKARSTGSTLSTSSNINHYNYRPSMRQIVLDNARVDGCNGKKMALVCCGPPSMADDVRAATVLAMKDGADGIDFIPESFTW